MSKSVLLTGASGFLGKALLAKLLDHGYQVFVMVRSQRGMPAARRMIQLGFKPGRNLHMLEGDLNLGGALMVCLSSEKLTTSLTELLTTPRWNNWCEYPSSRRSRMVHVPSRALQLVSTCAACSSCRFSSEKGVIGWFAHSRSCCSTSK